MNHSVHLCWSWCLTLKLAGSSKTVTMVSPSAKFSAPLVASDMAPFGEMGMVSSGTGSDGVGPLEATSAILYGSASDFVSWVSLSGRG